jgi:hypothetical protein
VILAPNCEKDEFRPPAGHSSGYYFSPTSRIIESGPSKWKKGSSQGTTTKAKKTRTS